MFGDVRPYWLAAWFLALRPPLPALVVLHQLGDLVGLVPVGDSGNRAVHPRPVVGLVVQWLLLVVRALGNAVPRPTHQRLVKLLLVSPVYSILKLTLSLPGLLYWFCGWRSPVVNRAFDPRINLPHLTIFSWFFCHQHARVYILSFLTLGRIVLLIFFIVWLLILLLSLLIFL